MRPLVAIVAVAALVAIAAMASAGRSGSAATAVIAPPAPRVWEWPAAPPTEGPIRARLRPLFCFILPTGANAGATAVLHPPPSPPALLAGYNPSIDLTPK